jgi:hypothetical protein
MTGPRIGVPGVQELIKAALREFTTSVFHPRVGELLEKMKQIEQRITDAERPYITPDLPVRKKPKTKPKKRKYS